MRLDEFERSVAEEEQARYSARLDDAEGNEYRLVILGADVAIRDAFADGEFDVSITPGGTREEWEREMEAVARRVQLAEELEPERLETFFKKSEPPAEPESRVIVLLRQVGPGGTFFRSTLRFGVVQGTVLQFSLPPVFACLGQLRPQSGDPDLFLRLNGPTAPVIASSVLGGTSVDTVSHLDFTTLFVPFFDVFGFQTSITIFDFLGFRFP